jgi:hypothetical protein
MKHYVFGKVGGEYKCVSVDAPSDVHFSTVEVQAQNNNEGFIAFEVVTKRWCSLYKKYTKLYNKCVENDLFFDEQLCESINGYRVNESSLKEFLYVCVDDYNDTTIPIYYLNEIEFSKVVDMLEICVDSVTYNL